MKWLKWIVGCLLLLFVAGYFYLSYSLSQRIVHPPKRSIATSKKTIDDRWGFPLADLESKLSSPIDFTAYSSFDSTAIKGWYYKQDSTANCAVILAHGWSDNRLGVLNFGQLFWDCGCDIVTFDHRGHNESGGIYATGGFKEKFDLISVTEWLQKRTGYQDHQIGWMGSSWGASAVLQAGALDKDVRFIMAESPFQDWYTAVFERAIIEYGPIIEWISPAVMWMVNLQTGIDYQDASALKAASNIKEPVLLIHSKQDQETASSQSVNISKKLNPQNSEFHHLSWGASHCRSLRARPDEFRTIVYKFLGDKAAGWGVCNN